MQWVGNLIYISNYYSINARLYRACYGCAIDLALDPNCKLYLIFIHKCVEVLNKYLYITIIYL